MLTAVTQVACIPVNRQRTVSPVAALMGTALTGKYCRVPRRTLGYSQTVLHGTTGYGLSRPGGRADRCGTGYHAPRLQHQQRPPVPLHAVAGCPRHQLCGGRASSLRHELAALRRGLGRCQRQVRHAVPERSPLREPRASASARARARSLGAARWQRHTGRALRRGPAGTDAECGGAGSCFASLDTSPCKPAAEGAAVVPVANDMTLPCPFTLGVMPFVPLWREQLRPHSSSRSSRVVACTRAEVWLTSTRFCSPSSSVYGPGVVGLSTIESPLGSSRAPVQVDELTSLTLVTKPSTAHWPA
jgi:hypothetical protein